MAKTIYWYKHKSKKKNQKMILKEIFLGWWIKPFLKKHRDIKLVTTEKRRNYLVSEPNYLTTKLFTENLLAIEMKKSETLMNKPVHLGLSIIEFGKILIH